MVHSVLHGGPAVASPEARQAAFAHAPPHADPRVAGLLDKVVHHAYRVTAEDIAGAREAGLTEDAIFELVVCAALGQADRQLGSALAALAAAKDPGEGTR